MTILGASKFSESTKTPRLVNETLKFSGFSALNITPISKCVCRTAAYNMVDADDAVVFFTLAVKHKYHQHAHTHTHRGGLDVNKTMQKMDPKLDLMMYSGGTQRELNGFPGCIEEVRLLHCKYWKKKQNLTFFRTIKVLAVFITPSS